MYDFRAYNPLWKYEFSQGIILWKPQTAIISERIDRCKKTLSTSLVGGMGMMFIGTLVFNLIPGQIVYETEMETRDRLRLGKRKPIDFDNDRHSEIWWEEMEKAVVRHGVPYYEAE